MKKITLLLLLTIFFGLSSQAQDIVAYWNQNSNDLPGGGFGFLADPDAFPQAADLGAGLLTVGGGILSETSTNGDGDLVYTWIPSFAGSEINAEDGDPAGGSISIQGGTDTQNNGAYIQFEFSMTNKENLEISYATRGTASGFSTQTWSWSTDGTNFTDFNTLTDTNVTTYFLAETTAPANLDGVATVFLRVTFNGASTSTGNNRMDNIKFVAGTLSTNSFDKAGFTMYPNPTNTGSVTITTNTNQNKNVVVFDVLGKQVLAKNLTGNTLNVSSLKSGIYLVQVTEGNTTSTKKLIIK